MELDTIGKKIRHYRLARSMRQEDLAEKTGLSPNYIGVVERGDKVPALATFIKLANALDVSADMLLADVLNTGYTVKESLLSEKLEQLSPDDKSQIYEVIDTLIKHKT